MSTEQIVERSSEIYAWIDKNYIEKILNHYHCNQNVTLVKWTIKHATVKGDNYVGAVFRVNVSYRLNHTADHMLSMILKTSQENDEQLSEILEATNIFQREAQVYRNILNECSKLFQAIDADNKTIIGPSLIYADEKLIALQDLSIEGYRLRDARKRLNANECKAVLQKVAKFHAATAVLNETKPELFKYHRQGNLGEKFTPYHLVYQNTIKSSIKYAETIPELNSFITKLKKFGENILPALIDIYSIDSNESITVLNHGDLWINNMLFNDMDDVILIDYQEGFYGSPGIDLNWFIYTSCNQDVLSNGLDEIIEFYHRILTETLIKLKYNGKIVTVADVKAEINRKAKHGLATLLCMTPILIMENKEYAEARYIIGDDEEAEKIRDIIFNNKIYGQLLIDNLPSFVQSGHL